MSTKLKLLNGSTLNVFNITNVDSNKSCRTRIPIEYSLCFMRISHNILVEKNPVVTVKLKPTETTTNIFVEIM